MKKGVLLITMVVIITASFVGWYYSQSPKQSPVQNQATPVSNPGKEIVSKPAKEKPLSNYRFRIPIPTVQDKYTWTMDDGKIELRLRKQSSAYYDIVNTKTGQKVAELQVSNNGEKMIMVDVGQYYWCYDDPNKPSFLLIKSFVCQVPPAETFQLEINDKELIIGDD